MKMCCELQFIIRASLFFNNDRNLNFVFPTPDNVRCNTYYMARDFERGEMEKRIQYSCRKHANFTFSVAYIQMHHGYITQSYYSYVAAQCTLHSN